MRKLFRRWGREGLTGEETALLMAGFCLLLLGGISYTIGAVLYGIGSRKKWMHSVFHIFVLLGSILQFFAVLLYAL